MGDQRWSVYSPDLLAAQRKLQILREQRKRNQHQDHRHQLVQAPLHHGRYTPPPSIVKSPSYAQESALGAKSSPALAANEVKPNRLEIEAKRPSVKEPSDASSADNSATLPDPCRPIDLASKTVKLYPDIALGMLRKEQVAAGRIWLLLRYLDNRGSGWVEIKTARDQLAGKDAGFRVCGRRQLRKLLARGDGIFWNRSNRRIWLRSPVKVAAALGVYRLTGHPVALPINVLYQGVGTVRAHFYASFHSGRTSPSKDSAARPIARRTLRQLCHVSRQTQRTYEKRAGVKRQSNYALGAHLTAEVAQLRAWRHGQAVFKFTDSQGAFGQNGRIYLAWQLPNNYAGPHMQQPKGRQRRINRELADLFTKGMTGNGKRSMDSRRLDRRRVDNGRQNYRRFYQNGSLAAKRYSRRPASDLYWRSHLRKTNRYNLWHVLPGQEIS